MVIVQPSLHYITMPRGRSWPRVPVIQTLLVRAPGDEHVAIFHEPKVSLIHRVPSLPLIYHNGLRPRSFFSPSSAVFFKLMLFVSFSFLIGISVCLLSHYRDSKNVLVVHVYVYVCTRVCWGHAQYGILLAKRVCIG